MADYTLNILRPSVNNLTARIFVRAADLDFEEIDVWGKTMDPEYLDKYAPHLTPTLEDPALVRGALGESCAIMAYLSNKHGLDQFYPTDPAERAHVDNAMFYLIGTLYPYLARATYPTLQLPAVRGRGRAVGGERRAQGAGPAGREGRARRSAQRLRAALPRRPEVHRRRLALDRRHPPRGVARVPALDRLRVHAADGAVHERHGGRARRRVLRARRRCARVRRVGEVAGVAGLTSSRGGPRSRGPLRPCRAERGRGLGVRGGGTQPRSAASSQRISALRPASVISPSADSQSRTRSSRTSPRASLGPGPSPETDSALVPGSIRQRPESSAASARPWSAVGRSSGCGPALRSGSSPGRLGAGRSAGDLLSQASAAPNAALPTASLCSRSQRPRSSTQRRARSASAFAVRESSSTSICDRRSTARDTSSESMRAMSSKLLRSGSSSLMER